MNPPRVPVELDARVEPPLGLLAEVGVNVGDGLLAFSEGDGRAHQSVPGLRRRQRAPESRNVVIIPRRKVANGGGDPARRLYGIFVLPDSDGTPSRLRQELVGLGVPGSISIDLGAPEVTVRACWAAVIGAPMPEAPVYEDGDTSTGEDEVGGSPYSGKRTCRYAVAQTFAMQQ